MGKSLAWSILTFAALNAHADTVAERLVDAAVARTGVAVRYDGAYRAIPYPAGDVPDDIGVCTDLVIRAYRAIGVDLQRAVHEDMAARFDDYPSRDLWGLNRPDANIDHRRVPNLRAFFRRAGAELSVSDDRADYRPGDVVTWMLPGNLPHIGIVTDRIGEQSGAPMVVHNIGAGPQVDDSLFVFPITGHYRYLPETSSTEGADGHHGLGERRQRLVHRLAHPAAEITPSCPLPGRSTA